MVARIDPLHTSYEDALQEGCPKCHKSGEVARHLACHLEWPLRIVRLGRKQLLSSLKQELAPHLHVGIKKDEVRTLNGLKGESMKYSVFQQPPGKDRLWVVERLWPLCQLLFSYLLTALGKLWGHSSE